MRKFLVVLVALLVPLLSWAGAPKPVQYWVCSQPGVIGENTLVYVVHEPFKASSNDYDTKEDKFEKDLQELVEDFIPIYDAVCRDFTTLPKVSKYVKKMVAKAEKRNFYILWVTIESKKTN